MVDFAERRQLMRVDLWTVGGGKPLASPIGVMYVIEHEGRQVAFVTATDIELAVWVDRQGGYVVGRWVVCQAVFAQGVAAGRLEGPVTEGRAEYFARCALMPDAEFDALAGQEDYVVAGHFDVPIEQVAEKHEDRRLAVLGER